MGAPYGAGQTQGNYNNEGGNPNFRGDFRGGNRYNRGRGGPRGGRGGNFQQNRGGNYPNNQYRQNNPYHNNRRGGMQGGYNQNMQQPGGMQGQPGQPGQPGQQQAAQQQMGQMPNQQMGQPPQQQQQMMPPQQQQQRQQMALPQVDVSQLDQLTGDERNNFVGNNIYQTIHNSYGEEFAPTITGMLLDESAVDFKILLTQNDYFQSKAQEAYALLVQSRRNEQE